MSQSFLWLDLLQGLSERLVPAKASGKQGAVLQAAEPEGLPELMEISGSRFELLVRWNERKALPVS